MLHYKTYPSDPSFVQPTPVHLGFNQLEGLRLKGNILEELLVVE